METHVEKWGEHLDSMRHIETSWFLKNMMTILPFLIFCDGQRSQNELYKGSGTVP